MNDIENSAKKCPINFKSISVDPVTKALIATFEGEFSEGGVKEYITPLYFFAPLADAVNSKSKYEIAFAPKWPVYARKFVEKFDPMPDGVVYTGIDEKDIGVNKRSKDEKRGWDQITYKGWPLYYIITSTDPGHLDFKPSTPEDFYASDTHPAMFVRATTEMETIVTESDVTFPGPYLGP